MFERRRAAPIAISKQCAINSRRQHRHGHNGKPVFLHTVDLSPSSYTPYKCGEPDDGAEVNCSSSAQRMQQVQKQKSPAMPGFS
jgi:hypothetical protein